MILICHITSVHPRFDTRIFHKQCRSIASAGFKSVLIAADGLPDEEVDGVSIIGIPRRRTRLRRMWRTPRELLSRALKVEADIYHLHDPELLTIALPLVRAGKKVVFDSHEDVPLQILSKTYLWRPVRRLISQLAAAYEKFVCSRIDAVIAATPTIRDKFLVINQNSFDVNNYPRVEEFQSSLKPLSNYKEAICYVGGISRARGILEVVQALELTTNNARLFLGGKFMESETSKEARTLSGWGRVDELGWLSRQQVADVMGCCSIGLVTLHPTAAYVDSLPVKLFEYMGAGLPVVASDFPLWRKIIEQAECGVCVDPLRPDLIAQAVDWFLDNPLEARRMGENGRKAVNSYYNWGVEEKKLLELYRSLCGSDSKYIVPS